MKVRLVSFFLGVVACLPLASSADQDVQARFEKSLKYARSLTNVEIQMIETSICPASPKERDFSSIYQYTFIASGPKFRTTCKLVSAAQTNSKSLSESAFNGTSFVTYDADARTVTRQHEFPDSDSSELSASPLIAPFMFLTKHSDDCPTCLLRFSDLVSPDFAKGLILPKGQESNGLLHISIPGLPLGKKPTSWNIDLAEAGDSFTPETVTLVIEAGEEIVWRLLNYTNVGGYPFPARIEMTGCAYPPTSPPTLMSTGTVTVISARIPDRIPDSTFNLDEEEKAAATVWDRDQNKTTKSPYDQLKAGLRTQPQIYDESADGSKQIADALATATKERKHVTASIRGELVPSVPSVAQAFRGKQEHRRGIGEGLRGCDD